MSFTAVAADGTHSCGLTSAGAAYCWGGNEERQLGNGSTADSPVPVAVAGGLSFSALAAGGAAGSTSGSSDHTCALTSAGAAYCWGSNAAGLGDGSTTSSSRPVAVAGGARFSAIVAGPMHSCGLDAGAAYCWGDNTFGQLGNGSTADSPVPVAVAGGLSFNALAAGGFPPCSGVPCPAGAVGTSHTCGLTSNGAAYCWGSNGSGQLGDGSITNSSTPVVVSGGLSFQAVAAGLYHTCGLTIAGAAYCWGQNTFGQLGNGSTAYSRVPVAVAGGFSFSACGRPHVRDHDDRGAVLLG